MHGDPTHLLVSLLPRPFACHRGHMHGDPSHLLATLFPGHSHLLATLFPGRFRATAAFSSSAISSSSSSLRMRPIRLSRIQ